MENETSPQIQKKVWIEITEEDAELFLWMRHNQDIFEKARKELRPGSLTLHFNSSGEIKKREFHIY